MSRHLGYVPQASVNELLSAAVDVENSTDAPGIATYWENVDASGWQERIQPNRYVGALPGDAWATDDVDEVIAALMRDAGLPYVSAAVLQETRIKTEDDPRLDELKAHIMTLRKEPARSTKLWHTARAWARQEHLNVWAVLIAALRVSLQEYHEQLRYDLDRLHMYGAMAAEMGRYVTVLQSTQQALDNALAHEKDDKKRAFIEVPMDDQRHFGPESLYALQPDGSMYFTQQATKPAPVPAADDLIPHGEAAGAWWRLGYGVVRQTYTTPDGKRWLGHGADDITRRQDVIKQITQQNEKAANAGNMAGPQGLGMRLQIYTQQREQLQKLIDKWQNRFHMDNEAKNQTLALTTNVLKLLQDMQSTVTRNVQ